jgi:catechol 2,3-dioxygenase-like lactoylglutathione lyase family enzyme
MRSYLALWAYLVAALILFPSNAMLDKNATNNSTVLIPHSSTPKVAEIDAVLGHGGLRWITISVQDMEKSLAFFARELGLEQRRDFQVRLPAKNSLLISGHGDTRIVLLENPGATLAGIRLVQAPGMGKGLIRRDAAPHDYGFFDVAFAAEDTARVRSQLVKLGYPCKNVVGYEVPSKLPIRIRESLCVGPDGVNIVFLQRVGETEIIKGIVGVLSSVRTVKNAEANVVFYQNVLGLQVRNDQVFDSDSVRHIVDLPPAGKLRIVSMESKPAARGRVLLFEFTDQYGRQIPGLTLENREQPENLGIYLWSFEVENLDDSIQRAIAAGARQLRPPQVHFYPPYCGRRAATVRAADGAHLELIEAELHVR